MPALDVAKLTVSIQRHEGLRLHPYTDTTGNITIGWGRNLSGKGISNGEATQLLSNDISDVIIQAEAQAWWPNVQNDDVRARALCEIIYNIGLAGFNGFVKAIAALCDDDFTTAANEFRDSAWASQVGSQPGQRGYVLCQMIETGEDPS
jgi:lysozyme